MNDCFHRVRKRSPRCACLRNTIKAWGALSINTRLSQSILEYVSAKAQQAKLHSWLRVDENSARRCRREFRRSGFYQQPVGGGFDGCFQPARNSALGSPGGIGSRISTMIVPGRRIRLRRGQNSPELRATGRHGTPRPVVEEHDAGLIVGRRARRPARPFRENDDLPPVAQFASAPLSACREARRPLVAVDRDHLKLAREPAVEGDEEQLPLHQERRIAEIGDEGESLPGRLMLCGDEAGPLGNFSRP